MGTRSIPLTGLQAVSPTQATHSNAAATVAGATLGVLTALLAAQSSSVPISLILMLLPAPALMLLKSMRSLGAHALVWAALIVANGLLPEAGWVPRLPLESGHQPSYTLLLHLGAGVLYFSLLYWVIRLQQRDMRAGQQAIDLLERLSPQRLMDLANRPDGVDPGQANQATRAFNAHADHLMRLVSAFSMLRSDMKELSAIAARLRQKAAVQKERSDMGADQVSRLYENNDQISTRAEAIAQTTRATWDSAERILETTQQYEDDIRNVKERVQAGRDNIDRLFNQLVQVKAAVTAARTIGEKIGAVRVGLATAADASADAAAAVNAVLTAHAAHAASVQSQLDSLSTEMQRQFEHMEATVEELTTAIYNSTQVMTLFQEKVEVSFGMTRQIGRSVKALQEENASTASAIEDLVVQMHNSQRKAMDLLSSLEFARNASQEAIAVIENSAHHIVRSEALVEEIDRELLRFKS